MRTYSPTAGGKDQKRIALLRDYPALPRSEGNEVPKQARETNFDIIEWIGILASVAFAIYLQRFEADQATALSLPVRYFFQFLATVPLLALLVGPFYLCRTRRSLNQEIQHRRGPGLSVPQLRIAHECVPRQPSFAC